MTRGTANWTTHAVEKTNVDAPARTVDAEDVLAQADAIKAAHCKRSSACEPHRALFELFKSTESHIAEASHDVFGLQRRAALVAAQSEILDIAASLPALSVGDCTYKLALWRADYCRHGDEAWPRGDIVAAALLEDLAAISGETGALPRDDEDDDA